MQLWSTIFIISLVSACTFLGLLIHTVSSEFKHFNSTERANEYEKLQKSKVIYLIVFSISIEILIISGCVYKTLAFI